MRTSPAVLLAATALLAVSTACGSATSPGAGSTSGGSGPMSTVSVVPPFTATVPSGGVTTISVSPPVKDTLPRSTATARATEGLTQPIALLRTGGIAGAHDRVVVNPDGSYQVTSTSRSATSRQLSEAELAGIVDALQRADIQSLADAATPSPMAHPDRFGYTIKAQGRTVSTTETAAPRQLRPLIAALTQLFAQPGTTP